MKNRLARLFPVLLMFALAAGTLWLSGIVQPAKVDTQPVARHIPEHMAENFTLTQFNKEGVADTVLTAERAIYYLDDQTTVMKKPHLRQQRGAAPAVQAEALSGWVDREGELVELKDDVHVVREDAPGQPMVQLDTSYLKVHVSEEFGETPEHVIITRDGSRLEGVGMTIDNKSHHFELLSRVTGTYLNKPRSLRPRS